MFKRLKSLSFMQHKFGLIAIVDIPRNPKKTTAVLITLSNFVVVKAKITKSK